MHCFRDEDSTRSIKMEVKIEICGQKLSLSYEMPMVILREFKCESMIKGYHTYMKDWTPVLGENLKTRPEPENEIDKYAVAVVIGRKVVGHLKKGKTGRYAKTVFYFMRADPLNSATITVTGKRVNLGDGQGLQIPCTILFKGEEKYIEILKKQLNSNPL